MTCPFCQSRRSRITKTVQRPGRTVRYRKCRDCKKNFPTVEYANLRINRRRSSSSLSILDGVHLHV